MVYEDADNILSLASILRAAPLLENFELHVSTILLYVSSPPLILVFPFKCLLQLYFKDADVMHLCF